MIAGAEFIQKVGEMGSDHAVQGIEVKEGDILIRGFTHNTLDRMHDTEHCPAKTAVIKYNNNPANHQENDDEYFDRKIKQLNFYLKKIVDKNIGYHFAFLQEVDLFFSDNPNCIAICNNFINRLKELGWDLIKTSSKKTNGLACKNLVTLYDTDEFEFQTRKGLFADNLGKKNTALETIFTHKTGRHVALTNVHFDYNKDGDEYSNEIWNYLAENTAKNCLTIMGGDTNHPREQLLGAIGNTQFATSFHVDKKTNQLSIKYKDNVSMSTIDSFFVSPGSNNSIVSAMPIDCTIFNNNFDIEKLSPLCMKQCTSAPGKMVLDYHANMIEQNSNSPVIEEYADIYNHSNISSIHSSEPFLSQAPLHNGKRAKNNSNYPTDINSNNNNNLYQQSQKRRVSFDELKNAIKYLTKKDKTPLVRYEHNQFFIGINYLDSYTSVKANNYLKSLRDILLKDLKICRLASRPDQGKLIEGRIIKEKQYRFINLSDEEADRIVSHVANHQNQTNNNISKKCKRP